MEPEPRFALVVVAFAGDRQVTHGGSTGFGSSALKVKGKIFAMMSSKGEFVVKLLKMRVDELVDCGKGERFDPGHRRTMEEWIVIEAGRTDWVELAR
ncbi:MAG: MmcQ/YjbR family DNA-binding protein [Terriglobia bacterium]